MAYCCRHSVVCVSGCLLGTTLNCAKMAKPIEIVVCREDWAQGTREHLIGPL